MKGTLHFVEHGPETPRLLLERHPHGTTTESRESLGAVVAAGPEVVVARGNGCVRRELPKKFHAVGPGLA